MSDAIETIKMPKWGMSMQEGEIVQWLVAEGEAVREGQELVEIESSKVVQTMESRASGVLRKVLAGPGEVRSVGEAIALVADASVSDEEIDAFAASLAAG